MFRYCDVKSFIGIVTQPEGLQVSILESNKNKKTKAICYMAWRILPIIWGEKIVAVGKNICMEVPLL